MRFFTLAALASHSNPHVLMYTAISPAMLPSYHEKITTL